MDGAYVPFHSKFEWYFRTYGAYGAILSSVLYIPVEPYPSTVLFHMSVRMYTSDEQTLYPTKSLTSASWLYVHTYVRSKMVDFNKVVDFPLILFKELYSSLPSLGVV